MFARYRPGSHSNGPAVELIPIVVSRRRADELSCYPHRGRHSASQPITSSASSFTDLGADVERMPGCRLRRLAPDDQLGAGVEHRQQPERLQGHDHRGEREAEPDRTLRPGIGGKRQRHDCKSDLREV